MCGNSGKHPQNKKHNLHKHAHAQERQTQDIQCLCKNNFQEIFCHKNDINVFIKHIRNADNEYI